MKKLLVSALAATMLMAAAPAFAGPADDAEQGYSTYPSPGTPPARATSCCSGQ
jgi:hypothetical protein